MIIEGHVQNGLIVVDQGGPLPEGTRVRIEVQGINGQQPRKVSKSLQSWVGQGIDLPDDLADNHDHYLHGQPKR